MTHMNYNDQLKFGMISEVIGAAVRVEGLRASIGDAVNIKGEKRETRAIVTAIGKEDFVVSVFSGTDGLSIGDRVYQVDGGIKIKVGDGLRGRVLNALGEPIDNLGELKDIDERIGIIKEPVPALMRRPIVEVFETGVRAIDGLLTIGKGQKMGIFAGSGVGKSTLLSMIVKNSKATVKIIAMVGERGREVPEFIENSLDGDLSDTIMVVATSDESGIMRKYGVLTALTIAEHFRDKGEDVLIIVDSITRLAMAQREIGLDSGEMPVQRGFPPSVFSLLPQVLERVANINGGSMTAFFTVLVDGDNLNEPISDQVRGILDGHIILDRKLTESGLYPPINITKSVSRVLNKILEKEDIDNINSFRALQSALNENETIIKVGAYVKGSDKFLDEAMRKKDVMKAYISQDENEGKEYYNSRKELKDLLN